MQTKQTWKCHWGESTLCARCKTNALTCRWIVQHGSSLKEVWKSQLIIRKRSVMGNESSKNSLLTLSVLARWLRTVWMDFGHQCDPVITGYSDTPRKWSILHALQKQIWLFKSTFRFIVYMVKKKLIYYSYGTHKYSRKKGNTFHSWRAAYGRWGF